MVKQHQNSGKNTRTTARQGKESPPTGTAADDVSRYVYAEEMSFWIPILNQDQGLFDDLDED